MQKKPYNIIVVVGTRPEAIKMMPLYLILKEDKRTNPILVSTGQHKQMLDQVFSIFKTKPDIDLEIMRPDQTLNSITISVMSGIRNVILNNNPDAILVHGDTSSCLAAALAASFEKIPIGHVEAGLRTYDLDSPWPEEMNRRLVDPISKWCFAPTKASAKNLRSENIDEKNIFITGNTIIDSLLIVEKLIKANKPSIPDLPLKKLKDKKIILVTGHRRESFGEPFKEFCLALCDLAQLHKNIEIVYPVHLNPKIQKPAIKILGNKNRINIIKPIDYLSFIYLMHKSYLIITDSGGIQEEAPTFGKPVIVTRNVTERLEAVEAGLAKLVGTNRKSIVQEVSFLINNNEGYKKMAKGNNPFGDGNSSRHILEIICNDLSSKNNQNKRG
jgi:UDP-N-acetylglucosamine 2-epimerase